MGKAFSSGNLKINLVFLGGVWTQPTNREGYNRSSVPALVVYPGVAGVEEGAGVEDKQMSFTPAPSSTLGVPV